MCTWANFSLRIHVNVAIRARITCAQTLNEKLATGHFVRRNLKEMNNCVLNHFSMTLANKTRTMLNSKTQKELLPDVTGDICH